MAAMLVLAVCVVVTSESRAHAQEADPAQRRVSPATQRALDAWAWYHAVHRHRSQLGNIAAELQRGTRSTANIEAANAAWKAAMAAYRPLYDQARDALLPAFEAAPIHEFDPTVDGRLMEHAISERARQLMDRSPYEAIEKWKDLIRYVPGSRGAKNAASHYLPRCYLSLSNVDRARTELAALRAKASETDQPRLDLMIGDLLARERRYDEALATWTSARSSIPNELGKHDPRGATKSYLDTRRRIVGKPAPRAGQRHMAWW